MFTKVQGWMGSDEKVQLIHDWDKALALTAAEGTSRPCMVASIEKLQQR